MKHQGRIALGSAAVILALLLGAAGCGKSLRTGADPNSISRVSVAAATDGTVQAGETKKFVAVGTDGTGQSVPTDYAWSLEPAALGTVAASGGEALVTGKTAGSGTLVAVASSGVRGEYPIVITAGPISDLRVEAKASKTTIEAGDSESFLVTGVDLGNNTVGQSRSRIVLSPAWRVQGGIGTITTAGVFTAAAAGIGKTGQVIAKVDDVEGSINVNVTQGSRALFVGVDTCKSCHGETHTKWLTSAHSTAYDDLKAAGRMGPNCVPCHVVGLNQGGFVDEETTPHLKNIQCENCHGAGSQHVAGNGDVSKILTGQQVLSKPEICGSCHMGSKHGVYEEWKESPHAGGEAMEYLVSHEYFAVPSRISGCGLCHTAAGRQAVRNGDPVPSREVAEGTPQTCAVCHNPHEKTAHGRQLRYPKKSTEYFTLNYSSPVWNDNIQVCGQCHNHRNANWTGTGRPPHYSGQYNMLIGDMGPESTSGIPPAPGSALSAHRDIEGQCTHCHMHIDKSASPPVFGHSFRVDLRGCSPCHSAADAGARRSATQADTVQRINAVQARLDAWALSSPLGAKYGKLAWEYSSVGGLSNPTGATGISGPTAAEQTATNVPDAIKKARFALYLIKNEGSYGVHNAKYARYLIDQANVQLDTLGVPR